MRTDTSRKERYLKSMQRISASAEESDSSYSNAEALTQQSMDTYYVSPGMTADYFDEIPDDEDLPF